MIVLENVSKSYPTRHGRKTVLDKISLTVNRGEKIGIIGRNGSGKSTLIRLIAGSEPPSSGSIHRSMSISWPLAFGGTFQGSLTGLDNVKFVCRIYDADYREKLDYIENFANLGRYIREPVKTYSHGMKTRLAFAISLAIEFDCYLIDEITSAGDSRFRAKCRRELFENRNDRAMIIVSHTDRYIEDHCDRAAILDNGKMKIYDDVGEAAEVYEEMAA